jgi:hypothetical protein
MRFGTFFVFPDGKAKTGLDNSHGMGYKKRERSVQPGGAAQHPQAHHHSAAPTAPVYRPAKQLQKGDHRNGYF